MIGRNTTSFSKNGIKANARKRVEQDVGQILKNSKLHDEVLSTTDKIQAIQNEGRAYQPQRWTVIPEKLRRDWYYQILPNPNTKATSRRSIPESVRRIWQEPENH